MKRTLRQALTLLGLGAILLLLPGCWDQWELKQRGLVLGLSIDMVEGEYQVGVQLPVEFQLTSTGAGGGAAGAGGAVFVGTGNDIQEAVDRVGTQVGRRLYFGHVQVIALGEETARAGVEHIARRLTRDEEVWPLSAVIVVRGGQGIDLLRSVPALEAIPVLHAHKLVRNQIRLGMLPDEPLKRFYIDARALGLDPVLPMVEIRQKGLVLVGTAVFSEFRMAGTLDMDETRYFLNLSTRRTGGRIAVPCPGGERGNIELSVLLSRPKVRVEFSDAGPALAVHTHFATSVREIPCRDMRRAHNDVIERLAEREVVRQHLDLIRRVQEEMGADIFGFGARIRGTQPELVTRERWPQEFRKLPVTVSVNIAIRRFGLWKERR